VCEFNPSKHNYKVKVQVQSEICTALLYANIQECCTRVTDKHNQKQNLEPFAECISVSDTMQIRWKTVSCGWTTTAETTLSKFGSGSWQNVIRCHAVSTDLNLYLPQATETVVPYATR